MQDIKDSKIATLKGMRIIAATILLIFAWWIFSDVEPGFSIYMFLMPLCYLFSLEVYIHKPITILFLPLLVNIALWVPSYYSYMFIRVVLYAEQLKLIIIMLFSLIIIPFYALVSYKQDSSAIVILMFIPALSWYFSKAMSENLQKEECRQYFQVPSTKSEAQMKSWTKQLTLIFIIVLIPLMTIETNLQISYRDYSPMESHQLHHKELKYLTNKNNFVYETRPHGATNATISADGKTLLLRINSEEDNNKDLFVFDTSSGENTRILQTPPISIINKTMRGYAFSSDGKYVVVGDGVPLDDRVRIQLYSVETGNRENRFSDPKWLTNKMHLTYIPEVRSIEFNRAGNYFAVVYYNIIEIWDYKKGQPVCVESFPNGIDSFTWLSNKQFLVASYDNYDKRIGTIIQYEILDNGELVKTIKNKIARDMFLLNSYFGKIKSSNDGKYVATQIREGGTMGKTDIINIWNSEDEEKLVEIKRTARVIHIEFHPDDRRLLILEELSDQTGRVTLWNITTDEKEQELLLPRMSTSPDPTKPYKAKIVDNGKKLIVLEKDIHIISIE